MQNSNNQDDPEESKERFMLRLFVAGASPNSLKAISNIKAICEEYLPENYELEVIDVHQQALLAEREQIIALPLLIKRFPSPERRLIGDMSDRNQVLKGLGLLTV